MPKGKPMPHLIEGASEDTEEAMFFFALTFLNKHLQSAPDKTVRLTANDFEAYGHEVIEDNRMAFGLGVKDGDVVIRWLPSEKKVS